MSRAAPPEKKPPARPSNRGQTSKKLLQGYSTHAGLATISLKPLSSDTRIEAYLAFLRSELLFSDNPMDRRHCLLVHTAYVEFRRSGNQKDRYRAWAAIQKAASRLARIEEKK